MFGLLSSLSDPWFSSQTGTLVGAFGGAAVGVLGAFIGVAGGLLAPRGKGRRLVLGLLLVQGVLGAGLALFGLAALLLGQAYAVWYPLTMIGGLCLGLGFGLYPVMRRRYREAESRKIDAEGLRQS